MKNKLHVGILGENLAVRYLQKKGYKIINRNFRTRNGEIDIIAIHKNILVFIEVKTRLSTQFGTPFEAIGYFKQQALVRTAEFYKAVHPALPDNMRLDAISVMLDQNNAVVSIEHLQSIT